MENRYNIEGIEIGLEEIVRLIPNDLYALKESIRQSIRKLHEPMQLAIIGKISTSKSLLSMLFLAKMRLWLLDKWRLRIMSVG